MTILVAYAVLRSDKGTCIVITFSFMISHTHLHTRVDTDTIILIVSKALSPDVHNSHIHHLAHD